MFVLPKLSRLKLAYHEVWPGTKSQENRKDTRRNAKWWSASDGVRERSDRSMLSILHPGSPFGSIHYLHANVPVAQICRGYGRPRNRKRPNRYCWFISCSLVSTPNFPILRESRTSFLPFPRNLNLTVLNTFIDINCLVNFW